MGKQPWYDIIRIPDFNEIPEQERALFYKEFSEAQAICLKNLKNDNLRNYNILIEGYYREEKKRDVADKYDLTPPRITQILDKSLTYVLNCLKTNLDINGD